MSYLVIARKYRPSEFSSVSGQEHITRTLGNAISRGKIGHAYLFAGPRGVGKTSTARIFSKALNCQKGPTAEPCNECVSCKDIISGRSLAVREIDGASHNSVDNVRDLIDSFRALPPDGSRYKIYIIDEVHMLSTAAFNALLKSLEEPPPHTVFILATTEVHKIPETVISRCQRFDFRALSLEAIEERLAYVVKQEKLQCEPEALRLIARLADGSMRDAQSLLDRVQTFCEGKITAKEASTALGSIEKGVLFDVSRLVLARDPAGALNRLHELLSSGSDPAVLMKEFVAHWRELFFAKTAGEPGLTQLGVAKDDQVELVRLVGPVSVGDIQDLYHLLRDGVDAALRSAFPKYALEALLVRLSTREPITEIAEIITSIKNGSGNLGGSKVSVQSQPAPQKVQASPEIHRQGPPKVDKPVGNSKVGAIDWDGFVRWVRDNGGHVISEHLRRLVKPQFSNTGLIAVGPEFSISSLLSERAKLENFLKNYLKEQGVAVETLRVDLKVGVVDNLSGQVEKTKAAKSAVDDHPAIQSVQKVFPGSKVERVKSRQ